MEKKYNHLQVEKNKYEIWKKNKFYQNNKSKESFTTILPPPNVTGNLHLGHAWDGILPDFLMRYNQLIGKSSTWFAGKDHAGIATQSKVENVMIKNTGKNRHDLGREKFIKEVHKFANNSSLTIEKQWSKLGLSLSYDKEKFTMDEDVNQLVNKTFVDYYNEGLIYRDSKLVSWDISLQTVISDIEVEHKKINGKLYYIKYFLENDDSKFIKIATTRPETMFADVAVFVNPTDKRYKSFLGKKLINPSNNILIPIIADEYVDIEFGTGALKVTPGHDFNDYALGKKHNLKILSCINKDGKINELGNKYQGKDRLKVRKLLISDLEKSKHLVKIEDHINQVGHSLRSDSIIEPLLSKQWYLKFPKTTINKIKKMVGKDINFYPERFNNTFIKWMDDLHEWCISRQLWWGHQIPVWYKKDSDEIHVSEIGPSDYENWIRDDDVLDTWFSSSLWPIATTELNNLNILPTSLMVTGYDLIFFWVSKMILQSIQLRNKLPFKDVLLHGMFRDDKGQKMSKSKGNGIDPMDVIENKGSDALRFFLLNNTTPGLDLNYNDQKMDDSWNFINKIWNTARLIEMKVKKKELKEIQEKDLNELDKYILNKYNDLLDNLVKNLKIYKIAKTSKNVYDFIYNDFANFYLEMIKHDLEDKKRQDVLFYIFNKVLVLLHPYLPMVTEEIFQSFFNKKSILLEKLEKFKLIKNNKINIFQLVKEIQYEIRKFKSDESIDAREKVIVSTEDKNLKQYIIQFLSKEVELLEEKLKPNKVVGLSNKTALNIFMKEKEINIKEIKNKIKKIESEILRAENMLSNKGFISKAPKQMILKEKEKIEKYKIEKSQLEELIY